MSLWHFPYSRERSPLATTVSYAARTFLLEPQAVAFQAHLYCNIQNILCQVSPSISTPKTSLEQITPQKDHIISIFSYQEPNQAVLMMEPELSLIPPLSSLY